MNDGGPYGLERHHGRAFLNRCAVSLCKITKTPVPRFPIPDHLGGNEGHPARRFASACGTAGQAYGALMDGNETAGAAVRDEAGRQTATVNRGHAAPVLINSFHNGVK